MALQSELEDPLKRWLKGGLSTKILQKGLQKFVDKTIKTLQNGFLSDICNFQSISEAKCTDCTTANCLPCPTKDICIVTGKGRNRNCSYHVRNDTKREYRPCPNKICEPSLRGKIQAQHQYNNPTWKNTDASKWCTMHWEIAKCYMPLGYGDKLSAAETDCSGLLHVIMNCAYVHKYIPTNRHFTKILNFRNKIFHSASLSLDHEELDHHIDLMIEILQDQNTLAQDPDAQNAVGLLTQLKFGTLIVSSKDELEIRAEQKAAYQARKLELQTSLCEIYDENYKTIPISPLLDEVEADIDDVVVDMIVCDDSHEGYVKNVSRYDKLYQYAEENKMGKTIEDYKGIFFKDNKSCKNIYISGEAGMGKTTWCLKMLRTWVTAMKKIKADPQTDTLLVDEKVMSEFDIVLFVSLRYAVNDGNIRDMVRNQLFQEIPNLESITSEVLGIEANKCLVILDGFDEWSPPENFISTSTLQNLQIPGHKDLHGCPVLTTTRSYKLHQVRLKERDVDNAAKIHGLKDYNGFAERVIHKRRREACKEGKDDPVSYEAFCSEVYRSFKKSISEVSFLRLPFILVFVLCSWLDNRKLEKTLAGNFSGLLECMILAAEKRKGRLYDIKDLDDLKQKMSKYKSFLPQLFQDRRKECSNYSLLILKLSKLAFDTLCVSNIMTKLFLPEELINERLSTKQIEVAVKIGILSQIKVVGKTLTRTSSFSFLHKTIQEHLAAVHLCSKTDDQQKALQIFKDCCSDEKKMQEYEQILLNVYGMTNIQTANFISDKLLQIYGMVYFKVHVQKMFKLFNKEMEESNNVKLSSMCLTYISKFSDCSNDTFNLEIIKTPLSYCKTSDTGMKESVLETVDIFNIQKTQTWLPSHWTKGVYSWNSVDLIANSEDDDVIKINMSHCVNLASVSFIDMSNCDIYLSQINLQKITTKGVNNCSIHINKPVESSELIQPPLKKIMLNETNNCTITLTAAKLHIDNLKFRGCDSCKLVIETDKMASQQVSEIDQLCLAGESQNIQVEKEDFKLSINHLYLKQFNLQTISKSFERYLHLFLWNVKVLTIKQMEDTKENWTTLKASFPYLYSMQTFSLSVEDEYSYYHQEVSHFEKNQSSALHSLQYATKLKELILINPSETIYNALAMALPKLTKLEKIEIVFAARYFKCPANISVVIESMKWLPFLTDITLIDEECVMFETLPLVLPHLKTLRKLDLTWFGLWSPLPFERSGRYLMASIQHVESLREIYLTLPFMYKDETDMSEGEPDSSEGEPDSSGLYSYKGNICLPPMPLLEKLCLKSDQKLRQTFVCSVGNPLPEKLLYSISNLPNLRHLQIASLSNENLAQLYQVILKLRNLKSLKLHFFSVSLDFYKVIASFPNTNCTIEVSVDDSYTNSERDNIKDVIAESRRFTLQIHVNTTNNSVITSYCLLPISKEMSTMST